MPEPTNTLELLAQIAALYAALDDAIAPILPAQMSVPGVNGAWSVKDELAHLTFWHQNLLARFQSVRAGQRPDSSTAIDDEMWNLRCFVANRDRALDDIMADLWRTQRAIVDGIDALPEALFFTAGAHGVALWEAVDGTVLGHYPEHIAQIAQWRAQHVTPPTMKSDLLFRIADGYSALTATIDSLPPRVITLPVLHDGWSIKDELAHLTYWEGRVLAVMQAAIAGEDPPHRPLVGNAEKIDVINAEVLAANRQRGIDDVLAAWAETHAAYVRAVEALPDNALFDPHHFPWTGGSPLVVAIAGDSYEHYPEHTRNIQRWCATAWIGTT